MMRSIDRTRSIARRCLGLTALAILLLGCVETYVPGKTLRPKTERLVIQHTAGGTYYGMELNGQIWYLLFGPELLVVNPESGRIVDQQDLSGAASHGPATAMLLVRRVPMIMVVAIASGAIAVTLGLAISFHYDTAGGATMAGLSVLQFFSVFIAQEVLASLRNRKLTPAGA